MVQGTASHSGKTIVTAALCRIFRDMGMSVAPFKAQNMALNSFVTDDGGEIGVAQALQARAAGIEPSVDMNPVLLKPTGDSVSQVIIHGRVHASMSAVEYHAFKARAMGFVMESFERLSEAHDVVVMEGAGSPAEINLRENDIANMGIARKAGSPVILVGDIDRGGVFASIVGTLELLERDERALIKAFIINKFRGDRALLQPGLDFLTKKTGIETLGVIPYMESMGLPDEDGVALERAMRGGAGVNAGEPGGIRIVVIRLPRISNFTDFDPLAGEPGVSLEFTEDPKRIKGAGVVIIPGSKNTLADLRWLREQGFEKAIRAHISGGGRVFGICGGLQMLGRVVMDPLGVELEGGREEGLGLLDIETTLRARKSTFNVEAVALGAFFGGERVGLVRGFEIHTGESTVSKRPLFRITKRGGATVNILDGAVSKDSAVLGTYIHGLFHNDGLRRAFLGGLFKGAGLDHAPAGAGSYAARLEENIAGLARTVREAVDMNTLLGILGPMDPSGAMR